MTQQGKAVMTRIIIYSRVDRETKGLISFKFRPTDREGFLKMLMLNEHERYVPVVDYLPEPDIDRMFKGYHKEVYEEEDILGESD
jgi:hypothetical protein